MLLFKKKNKEVEPENFFLNNESPQPKNIKTEVAPDSPKEAWLEEDYEEGQLSVDVFQTKEAIVIKSTIAGVKPEDIDISINNDMVTIRGKREVEQAIQNEDYFYQEC